MISTNIIIIFQSLIRPISRNRIKKVIKNSPKKKSKNNFEKTNGSNPQCSVQPSNLDRTSVFYNSNRVKKSSEYSSNIEHSDQESEAEAHRNLKSNVIDTALLVVQDKDTIESLISTGEINKEAALEEDIQDNNMPNKGNIVTLNLSENNTPGSNNEVLLKTTSNIEHKIQIQDYFITKFYK